jgi:hypothetical protein
MHVMERACDKSLRRPESTAGLSHAIELVQIASTHISNAEFTDRGGVIGHQWSGVRRMIFEIISNGEA